MTHVTPVDHAQDVFLLLAEERRHRERAERQAARSAFVAAASGDLLVAIEDYPGLLGRIARIPVPLLADWCLLRLACDGTEATVALAHVDPGKEPLLAPLDLGTLDVPAPSGRRERPRGVLHVDEGKGTPERFAECFPALEGRRHAMVVSAAREAGMSAFLLLPLSAGGRSLGALILVAAERVRRYDPEEVALAEALADRAAVAIDHAQRYREARRAARAREDFLVSASHELRTPLTSLQLAVQALLHRERSGGLGGGHPNTPGPGERAASRTPLLATLERSARRLGAILDDLIDFSYLAGSLPTPVAEEVDLRAVVEEVLAAWADVLGRSGCAVHFTAEGPTLGAWDRRWLVQTVSHLLSNAVRHGRGAPIEVTLEGSEDKTRLGVRDHGVGLSAAQKARIFERFDRPAPAEARYHAGGLGLGLWLVRRMVEGLGGSISVESAPGEGATFTVELPRQGPARKSGDYASWRPAARPSDEREDASSAERAPRSARSFRAMRYASPGQRAER